MTSIGKEEEMRQELFASLASMDHEIDQKQRDKYSLDDLLKLIKGIQNKGKRNGN